MQKQFQMMEIILYLNQKCKELVAMGLWPVIQVLKSEDIF